MQDLKSAPSVSLTEEHCAKQQSGPWLETHGHRNTLIQPCSVLLESGSSDGLPSISWALSWESDTDMLSDLDQGKGTFSLHSLGQPVVLAVNALCQTSMCTPGPRQTRPFTVL